MSDEKEAEAVVTGLAYETCKCPAEWTGQYVRSEDGIHYICQRCLGVAFTFGDTLTLSANYD